MTNGGVKNRYTYQQTINGTNEQMKKSFSKIISDSYNETKPTDTSTFIYPNNIAKVYTGGNLINQTFMGWFD